MGWDAALLRSRIERRRCASPTRRSAEIQIPAPSGPRCCIVSRIRHSSSGETESLAVAETIPTIPHIGLGYAPDRMSGRLSMPASLCELERVTESGAGAPKKPPGTPVSTNLAEVHTHGAIGSPQSSHSEPPHEANCAWFFTRTPSQTDRAEETCIAGVPHVTGTSTVHRPLLAAQRRHLTYI